MLNLLLLLPNIDINFIYFLFFYATPSLRLSAIFFEPRKFSSKKRIFPLLPICSLPFARFPRSPILFPGIPSPFVVPMVANPSQLVDSRNDNINLSDVFGIFDRSLVDNFGQFVASGGRGPEYYRTHADDGFCEDHPFPFDFSGVSIIASLIPTRKVFLILVISPPPYLE